MEFTESRTCKQICKHYRAIKPSIGSRYGAGQFRCQICEIYITEDGVSDGRYCKCCHYRVRGKPRNKKYKEQLRTNPQNHSHLSVSNSLRDVKNTNKKLKNSEIFNKKKSTEHSISYSELKEFLKNKIKLKANYQLVMLKELIEYGKLHQGEIAESLAYFNNKNSSDMNEISNYFHVPVYDVLLKHELIKQIGNFRGKFPIYEINVNMSEIEKISILEFLRNEISDYNLKNNIPENQHPDANNMGSINWEKINFEKKLVLNESKNLLDDNYKICIECQVSKIPKTIFRDICNSCFKLKKPQIKSDIDNSNLKPEKIITGSHDLIHINSQRKKIEILKLKKISSIILNPGDSITNDQLTEIFEVGNMGGIRYSTKNNILILLTTNSNDYNDEINDSEVVIYTGEGKQGDQLMIRGNERIRNSKNSTVLLFREIHQEPGMRKRGALDNIYTFVGVVSYLKHYFQNEDNRKVIKFVLEIKNK